MADLAVVLNRVKRRLRLILGIRKTRTEHNSLGDVHHWDVKFPMPPSIPLTVLIVAIIFLSLDGLSAYVAHHIDNFANAELAQMHQEERKIRLGNDRIAIGNCEELAKIDPSRKRARLAQCLNERPLQ